MIYLRLGRLDEAEQLCRQSWEASREVLGESAGDTFRSLNCLARTLTAQGKLNEARPYFGELIRYRRQNAEQPDASAMAVNLYAWDLLTCELEDLRDPQAALPVAKRAVEKNGSRDPRILDTLALAYFMTGDTTRAIETQEKAVSLLPPGKSDTLGMKNALAKYRAALMAENAGDGTRAKEVGGTP